MRAFPLCFSAGKGGANDEVLRCPRAVRAWESVHGRGVKFAPCVGTRHHDDGEHYICADSHARWMRFRQILNPIGRTDGSMWVQALLRNT